MNGDRCFYCRMPLASAALTENDHAPVAKRHGGTSTVPACLNCHTLKDRIPSGRWPEELLMQALEECGPLGRIYLASAMATIRDREDALGLIPHAG